VQANIAAAGYGQATVGVRTTGNREAMAATKGLFLTLGSGMNLGALPRDGRSLRLEAHDLTGKRVAEGHLSSQGQPVWTSGSLPTGAYFVKAVP